MKWRGILGVVAVFLAMSGSMLGSEPEIRLQARWGELKKLIGGKKVALQLSDGARVEGRIRKVIPTSLDFKVTKSSESAAYPKGEIQIQRETISRIEVRGLTGNTGRQVGAAVGTFAGTLIASFVAIRIAMGERGGAVAPGVAVVAIPTAAAVLVYRALAPKKVTLIEILPDSPGEGEPKPRNKDQSSTPTASGEALALSLIEESSAERLRRQSRRALMRKGLPLDLSSRPVHAHSSGID